MPIQLDNELYRWLISLGILSSNPKHKFTKDDKYELDEQTSKQFENGKKLAELVKQLLILSDDALSTNYRLPKFDTLKETNTPSSRLYNWNFLSDILEKLNLNIDPDIKSLLIAGFLYYKF